MTDTVDTTVLPGLLTALRLPSIARHWQHYVTVADREGWPAARLLGTLLELEVAERAQRRIQRHQAESGLPPGKTFATFDFTAAPGLRKGFSPEALNGISSVCRDGPALRLGVHRRPMMLLGMMGEVGGHSGRARHDLGSRPTGADRHRYFPPHRP